MKGQVCTVRYEWTSVDGYVRTGKNELVFGIEGALLTKKLSVTL